MKIISKALGLLLDEHAVRTSKPLLQAPSDRNQSVRSNPLSDKDIPGSADGSLTDETRLQPRNYTQLERI